MSDKWLQTGVAGSTVPQEPGTDSWLPPINRRWIVKYALAMTAVTNLVINGLLAWLTTIGHAHLDLVGLPLVGAPSLVTDTLGTLVILPITTSVLCSLGIRGYLHRGLLDPIRLPAAGLLGWLDRLPAGDVRAGMILAGWSIALLGPGACGLLVALSSSGLSRGSFVLYKMLLGVALGAVITPAVAVRAMSQTSVSTPPVLT